MPTGEYTISFSNKRKQNGQKKRGGVAEREACLISSVAGEGAAPTVSSPGLS